jgi:hypothetical protein
MRIDLVTLCDAAVEVNGRLHVLGSIDYFWAAEVPYIHKQCALAIRLRWEGFERGPKHRLHIQVLDADGGPVATEFSRKFVAPSVPHDDVPCVRHVILDLDSLQFDSFGPYAVRVQVDGEDLATLPFSVVPLATTRRQQRAA